MLKAQQHARDMMCVDSESDKVKIFLEKYVELFSMEQPEPPEYDDSQMISEPQPPKSGFIPTYD
jgi:hypothetical protein